MSNVGDGVHAYGEQQGGLMSYGSVRNHFAGEFIGSAAVGVMLVSGSLFLTDYMIWHPTKFASREEKD